MGLLLVTAFGLSLLLSFLYLLPPHSLQVVNLKITDILVGFAGQQTDSNRVVSVDIDERSLREFGQWPWPRNRVARLLARLDELGAASVGITIIFPEPDRSSLKNIQEMLTNDFGATIDLAPVAGSIRDPDEVLAETLVGGPFVLGYSFRFSADASADDNCLLHPVSPGDSSQSGSLDYYQAQGVVCNYRLLTESISASGFHNGSPDSDGVLRRLPLLIKYHDMLYPSFALATLQKSTGQGTIRFHQDRLATMAVIVDGHKIPVDEHANFLFGPPKGGRPPNISAADILRGEVAPSAVEGKIVLVGTTAAGLTQNFAMPFAEDLPLLEVLRLTVENLLTDNISIRTEAMPVLEVVATLLLAVPVGLMIVVLTPFWSTICCSFLLGLILAVDFIVYRGTGYLFSPLLPGCAIMVHFGVLHVLRYRKIQRDASQDADVALGLLENQQDNLRSILNAIPDIVFRLDQDGNITYVSPAISRYLQDPGDILGRSIFELVAPEDKERARFRLNERRTGDRSTTNMEIRLQLVRDEDHPGASRHFSVSAEGLYLDTTPSLKGFVGTQGIVRDITEKKELERQLVQAQKMEVVGNLAAGIAHDLNNILSGLVSYPDLLLMELPEDSPLRAKVGIIQKSGRKAAVIVQDLLALTRRNIDIEGICNLNSIASDYLASAEFQRVRDRYPVVNIRHDLQPELMNCHGSPVHLSKVLMNAIHNALEAMPAGGEVVISTVMRELEEPYLGYEVIPSGRYVVLRVQDNGVGIATAELVRIFEPFYTKKTMDRSGTGLGMTVIWSTVKDHGGYLNIISAEGAGTTLEVYLPATVEHGKTAGRRIVLEDYVGSESLLIVDDDNDQRVITSKILAKLGYQVVIAANGEEGLAIVERETVDLVVLDMVMPGGMDGLESYRKMKDYRPDLKAVIISGFSESDRVREAQRLGAGGFVQKPYSMEQLGMAIRAELDRSPAEGDR